jgi:hypothetical protein
VTDRIIPAPAGWTFHVAEDWEVNTGKPVVRVYPVFAFELSEELEGRPQQGAGIYFLDTYSHQLCYTNEQSPYRYGIGMFGPGLIPDPEAVESALNIVKWTAARARKAA